MTVKVLTNFRISEPVVSFQEDACACIIHLDAVVDHHQLPCERIRHQAQTVLPEGLSGDDANAVVADGRKWYSQDKNRSYHSTRTTLGKDTGDELRTLLNQSVNADLDATDTNFDEIDTGADDTMVVSDTDEDLSKDF